MLSTDGSHIYDGFLCVKLQTYPFLRAFLKNVLDTNARMHLGYFKRIQVLSGPFEKKHIHFKLPPRPLIRNPTHVRGTRLSFGPEPARVLGRTLGFRIQVDP